MPPATEWSMSDAELQTLPGFGEDIEKNRAEAKRLLPEAGYPNGFKTVLKDPQVSRPKAATTVLRTEQRKNNTKQSTDAEPRAPRARTRGR